MFILVSQFPKKIQPKADFILRDLNLHFKIENLDLKFEGRKGRAWSLRLSVRTPGFSAKGGPPSGWHPKYMWFVYLLQSHKDDTYYIGYTEDIKKRLLEHNKGKTKSIKHKIPYKLIYCEIYCNKTVARKRELELKNNSFKKKELLDRIKNEVPSSIG